MQIDRTTLENRLKQLPKPLVGSLAFDHKDVFRLRDSCIDMIKEVIDIARPKNILEIGTHLGHSACLWLSLSDANLVSVDIGTNWVQWEHGFVDWNVPNPNGKGLKDVTQILRTMFPGRFCFILGDSTRPATAIHIYENGPYDLTFIDGNHAFEYIEKDIETALTMRIPYIHLDDVTNPEEDTWRAAHLYKLQLVKQFTSIHNTANIGCALFKNPYL